MRPARAVLAAAALLAACVSPPAAQEGRGIDVKAYCRKVYGDSADATQVRSEGGSWTCVRGKRAFPIEMSAVCRLQYDTSYVARLSNPSDSYSWSCFREVKPAG